MSDEYIRKVDAINIAESYNIKREGFHLNDYEYGRDQVASSIASDLEDIESADVVQVVHSRWIKTADGAECEKCGREAVYQIVDDHWQYEPYCPHCGARMEV